MPGCFGSRASGPCSTSATGTRRAQRWGRAGSPGDPHFRDLYLVWLANESFPLAFSAEQVARVAESHIRLQPTAP